MSYEIFKESPSVDDYLRIRKEAGLSPKSVEAATKGLPNSLFAVQVIHKSRVVGMGRVIGDGGCWFEIVDVAVVPEHQGKGLGKRIMQEIMQFIERNALPGAYVSLLADAPEFYKPFGFKLTSPPYEGMCLWFSPDKG